MNNNDNVTPVKRDFVSTDSTGSGTVAQFAFADCFADASKTQLWDRAEKENEYWKKAHRFNACERTPASELASSPG